MASSQPFPYIQYLKLYALAAAGVQAGMIISMSYPTIPALLHGVQNNNKRSLLSVWSSIYHRGKAAMPPLAITTSASFLAVAYALKNPVYAFAGIAPPFIVPFTFTVMRGNVAKLLEMTDVAEASGDKNVNISGGGEDEGKKKEDQEEEDDDEVSALDVDVVRQEVDRWGALNLIRAMFPLTGFVVGLYATVF